MAQVFTVRNLDENVQKKLRHRAVDKGHSFEAEVRAILEDAANEDRIDPDPPSQTPADILFESARKFREAAAEVGGFTMPERIVEYQPDVIL